jgi:hypothetical protein
MKKLMLFTTPYPFFSYRTVIFYALYTTPFKYHNSVKSAQWYICYLMWKLLFFVLIAVCSLMQITDFCFHPSFSSSQGTCPCWPVALYISYWIFPHLSFSSVFTQLYKSVRSVTSKERDFLISIDFPWTSFILLACSPKKGKWGLWDHQPVCLSVCPP